MFGEKYWEELPEVRRIEEEPHLCLWAVEDQMDEDSRDQSEEIEEWEEEEEQEEGRMDTEEESNEEYVQVLAEDGRLLAIPLQLFRLITGGLRFNRRAQNDDEDSDDTPGPSTTADESANITLLGSDLENLMNLESGISLNMEPLNIGHLWHRHQEAGSRHIGEQHAAYRTRNRPLSERSHRFLSSQHVPNQASLVDRYSNTVFCAEYSSDGDLFVTASQDRHIRIYDTSTWQLKKRILTQDMGWAVLCTDFSPNTQWVAYSGWHNEVSLVNTSGDHEVHEGLEFSSVRGGRGRIAFFSVKFSADSRELLAGANDNHFYLYDIETKQRTDRISAHDDDINNVAWADDSSQVFFTGSDDRLIKVWDRRTMRSNGKPSGVLPGHLHGITYIDSRGDGRYLLSNGKDQRIKLWDLRQMRDQDHAPPQNTNPLRGMFDYRMGIPDPALLHRRLENDVSIMTYRGHSVAETLIRAKFSPAHSTGQRYIYTGSHGGDAFIFDVLSGAIVSRLRAHTETVRDLDWHPYQQQIVTTGWDGRVYQWDWSPTANGDEPPNQTIFNRRRRQPADINMDDDD